MKSRLILLAAAVGTAVGCSLFLNFNPEGKPCSRLGTCLPGFDCVGRIDGAPGTCRQPQCEVDCAVNELCTHDRCVPADCAGQDCAAGAACENGQCVALACLGVQCGAGEACARGQCVPVSCHGVPCRAGSVCFPDVALCVDARCDGLSCPPDAGVCMGGACNSCMAQETACQDGIDEDCDGKKDCEDPDCTAKPCDDQKLCTTGEVCAADGTCGGGSATACSGVVGAGCFQATGECVEGTGCTLEPTMTGTACDAGPCSLNATCNGQGACVGTAKTCDLPSNAQCLTGPGKCEEGTGECKFTPKPAGVSPCDDGNKCTDNDLCDGAGACKGAAKDCDAGSCYNSQCVEGACVSAPRIDGSKCGTAPGERCCNAVCVNVSNDAANCGGCGIKCSGPIPESAAMRCVPINETPSTSDFQAISGRCQCEGMLQGNQQCVVPGVTAKYRCRDAFSGNFVPNDDAEDNWCIPDNCGPNQIVAMGKSRAGVACTLDNCAKFCIWNPDAGF